MNFFKRLASLLTGNNPSQTERGARPSRSPCSASPPNTSSPPPVSGWGERTREPSSLDNLPSNRNGKIAHLPRALRDRINLALYNRCPAKELAHALNQLPEVQAVMAQYFNGKPIRQQNISEWKLGGYRDWLHHRQILEQQRELTADAQALSDTAKGTAESLFGLLTLNYTHLMMNRDKDTPEEFEQKRKELSLVSQDISRMHRCHINTRRVEVQEARLERDEEKTAEQLHFKFMEWAENPAIRRALILAPMEANRQSRLHFGIPPRPEDPLVEQLTRNDPYFNPPNQKPAPYRPLPPEKSGTGAPPVSEKSSSSPASEKAAESNNDVNHPKASPSPGGEGRGEGELNSTPTNSYGDKSSSQLATEIEEQHNRPKGLDTNPLPTASEKAPESNNDTNQPTVEEGGASVPASRSDKTSDVQAPNDTVGTRCCASEAGRTVPPASEKAPVSNKDADCPIAVPSPGGSNERSECHFVCSSDVGKGEGELNNSGHQPVHKKVGRGTPCPPSSPPPASEITPKSNDDTNRPIASPSPGGEGRDEGELNSKLKTQNSPLPKPQHLSDYERALLEGKTFLEALYAQSTPAPAKAPASQGKDQPSHPKPNPLDTFSQPVPSGYQYAPIINFRPNSNWSVPG
jgi:hypothetical protein